MSELLYERVMRSLGKLKLTSMAAAFERLAEQAARDHWTYLVFLDCLLEAEVAARSERDVANLTKLAHFPFLKTLDQFDFTAQPSITERQVKELATSYPGLAYTSWTVSRSISGATR